MLNLSEYTPIVDLGLDEIELDLNPHGYKPSLYDDIIDDIESDENKTEEKHNTVKRNEFLFTDEMRKSLKLNLDSKTRKVYPKTNVSSNNPVYKNRKELENDLSVAYRNAGITNENMVRMLVKHDMIESRGRTPQGKFNYGNITTGRYWNGDYVVGNDKDEKGNPIKQRFRSYNSLEDYVKDKVQFLTRLYDFDQNDDAKTFINKLDGGNKAGRRYAESPTYRRVLWDSFSVQ